MTAEATTATQQKGARVGVQRFGAFLSGMVMPNIPAFIAWGLITSLFIQTGWLNELFPGGAEIWSQLGGWALTEDGEAPTGLVGPMITYLLPLLIAFQGGKMIYDTRGGVVGAIATMGVIVGAGIPMFIGAMIMGPLAAWVMKKVDSIWDGKIRAGFEMLVNNFSAGILAMILAIAGFFTIAPIITWLTERLGEGVDFLVEAGLLPLASILIEPAKILFLNNAINQGVLTPLGVAQSEEAGKSILFLLEANPGPGLGLLLAFCFFGVGVARASAPGAVIIQFFGGIHEIYFPYVLAKPALILAVIGGGATGVLTNVIFQSGLVAPASPGSIFAILIMTAQGSHLGVILSVILSAAVTFAIAAAILLASRKKDLAAEASGANSFADAVAQTEANKGKKSEALSGLATQATGGLATDTRQITNIVFACDAGMGSSAMGASVLRNKIKKAGIEGVTVKNVSIANLDNTPDLIVTHQDLTDRAKLKSPEAIHVSVENFMNSPRYEEVVARLSNS
ncbi:PTS mannitol transporter subunit IIB [Pseudoclavibacter sp. AY1F1]|uniref:PTS mannitol transporter subunit IICB n=1 Tax=Pseudoclavibacter sp. AY1F1 TaxID=2080583 RepID=UPI000CE769C9|nr:PTS mannitol transporter subunit IICB [Pseudoclavibacter sp. AY1F1]PPF43846.1 PTS mannitol transporter subunit IIB [Pseudoclavibacter sp. AY1F1]